MQRKKIDHFELENFHEHLSMLVETKLPLSKGIRRFARNLKNPKFRQTIERLADGLDEGELLSQAMARETKFFPPEYIAIIRMGEKDSSLSEALKLAIDHEQVQNDFRQSVKNSLFYPLFAFVSICAIYTVAIIVTYPLFLEYFRDWGRPIPWVSQGVYAIYSWAGTDYPGILVVLLFIILGFRHRRVKIVVHGMMLKIPFLGRLLKERFIALFSGSMAVLLDSGNTVDNSLGLLADISYNRYLGRQLKKAAAFALEGKLFEHVLSEIDVFPKIYIESVSAGEKGGVLPETLKNLARLYKMETEYHTRLFLRVMETSAIVIIGIWVLCLLVGMYSMYLQIIQLFDVHFKW